MCAAPRIFSQCLPGGRRLLGNFDLQLAGQILPGQAARLGGDFFGRAHGDDLAAAHARARAEIDDRVGGPHRVFVVLDDDHRIAQVAQLGQRGQQPVVVARVQADRRLVEDVQHADQPAADLPGQADALRLAARERRRGARQRQIIEPHVEQEAQPAANLLEHLGRDMLPRGIELQLAEKIGRLGDRQRADLGQRALRLGAQSADAAS